MDCARLEHFAKFSPPWRGFASTAVISGCCVMVSAPFFSSYSEMISSQWLKNIKDSFKENKFPSECIRCQQKEEINICSDRMFYNEDMKMQSNTDYLTVDLMLDNICNTACQFCSPAVSTKIGSLVSSNYEIKNVSTYFNDKVLPIDRITQLDLTGGEPSNSKNIKEVLKSLPPNIKSIRVNTNCTSFMDELIPIAEMGISIQITISLDGVGKVQEYMRWPTKWNIFCDVLEKYKKFASNYSSVNINLYTTLTALNIYDFDNIINFAKEHSIGHSFNNIAKPKALSITTVNSFTLAAKEKFAKEENPILNSFYKLIASGNNNQIEFDMFVKDQDCLRKINIRDYITYG